MGAVVVDWPRETIDRLVQRPLPIDRLRGTYRPFWQGIIFLYDMDVSMLFDTGSMHSFITLYVVWHVLIPKTFLLYHLAVVTPRDMVLLGNEIFRDCEIMVCDKECLGDLIVLDIRDFDLILGMDWLFRHYAKVDNRQKIIYFELPQPTIMYRGNKLVSYIPMISIMKTEKLVPMNHMIDLCSNIRTLVLKMKNIFRF